MYTIGQVSELVGLPVSTLRYYDKEGLFPDMARVSGIRRFGEKELEAIRDGNEERLAAMKPEEMPRDIRQAYENAHQK